MLRKLGIAVLMASALAMPVRRRRLRIYLAAPYSGEPLGPSSVAPSAEAGVPQSVRSSVRGRGLPLPARVNGAGAAIIHTATAVISNAPTGSGLGAPALLRILVSKT